MYLSLVIEETQRNMKKPKNLIFQNDPFYGREFSSAAGEAP